MIGAGSRYSSHYEHPIVYNKSVVDAVVDIVEDVVDTAVDVATDIYEDVIEPVANLAIDLTVDLFDALVFEPLEIILDPIGLGGIVDTAEDFLTGVAYLTSETLAGNWSAAGQLAVIIGSVALTIATFGATSTATLATLSAYNLGVTSTLVLNTIYYTTLYAGMASAIYSIYGIVISTAELGAIVSAGGTTSLFIQLNAMKNAMNLAFVSSWINGSMNFWMAGGVLYDAPRAGDVLFNPTGNMNTTKFLNIPDRNSNLWMKWESGRMHDFQKSVFGNLAGNEFFAVSPLAQRI